MADQVEPNASLTGIGVPPNRVDSFASVFGAPGIPPVPPQAMTQGAPTESSAGNLAVGATDLANRLGMDSGPSVGSDVPPGSLATEEPGVSGGPNPMVSQEVSAPLSPEDSTSTIPKGGNVADALLSEAASQPVAPGIMPDMGGVAGEPQVPAESAGAIGGGDTIGESLTVEFLEDLRKSLGAADEAIKQAKEAADKLGANPTNVSEDASATSRVEAPKEPVGA